MNPNRKDLLDVVLEGPPLSPGERDVLRAKIEIDLLRRIIREASALKNWKAAAWALERLYPERYGKGAGQKSSLTVRFDC